MGLVEKIAGKLNSGGARTASVKKNVLGALLLKGASIFISFALVPLTIGYVSPELYGVWLTLSSILTWLCFLDIGFAQGLKNKLTEAIAKDDWEKGKSLVSTTYFMMVLIFIPVCVILELVVPLVDWCSLLNVNAQYKAEILSTLHVLVAMACMQMVVNILVSVVAAFQKVAISNTFTPIGNLISLIIIFVLTKTVSPSLVYLGFSLAAMPVLVTLAASVIFYLGSFKKVAPSFRYVDRTRIKDLFGLGYKFFIINIQVVVLYQSTNVLISNVSSPNEVTAYNIAYKLLNVAMMAYSIITAPLWPAYTDAYARGDFDWMKNIRKKMGKVLLCSILGCLLIAVCSKPIYYLWIGDRVEIPFAMTALVCAYVCAYCWMQLNGTIIVGIGKVKLETVIAIIGMIVHIPLALLLSQYIGAYGVLLSLISINLFYAIVEHIQANKLLNRTAQGIWNS